MTPEERMKKIKARAAGTERYQPCGVCMGHSPSWDGHDPGCRVSDMTVLINEVERLTASASSMHTVGMEMVNERDAWRRQADAHRDAIHVVLDPAKIGKRKSEAWPDKSWPPAERSRYLDGWEACERQTRDAVNDALLGVRRIPVHPSDAARLSVIQAMERDELGGDS